MSKQGPKEWSPSMTVAVKVNAGHDTNGNPRRGWVVTNCRSGGLVDFVDEGYIGLSALRRAHPHAAEGPELTVTPGEYRRLKKVSKEKGSSLGRSLPMAKVKRSVPPVLMAWTKCRMKSGVKPGVKMTPRQKSAAQACVAQELRSKRLGFRY